jgi:hypothetical protein
MLSRTSHLAEPAADPVPVSPGGTPVDSAPAAAHPAPAPTSAAPRAPAPQFKLPAAPTELPARHRSIPPTVSDGVPTGGQLAEPPLRGDGPHGHGDGAQLGGQPHGPPRHDGTPGGPRDAGGGSHELYPSSSGPLDPVHSHRLSGDGWNRLPDAPNGSALRPTPAALLAIRRGPSRSDSNNLGCKEIDGRHQRAVRVVTRMGMHTRSKNTRSVSTNLVQTDSIGLISRVTMAPYREQESLSRTFGDF